MALNNPSDRLGLSVAVPRSYGRYAGLMGAVGRGTVGAVEQGMTTQTRTQKSVNPRNGYRVVVGGIQGVPTSLSEAKAQLKLFGFGRLEAYCAGAWCPYDDNE